MTDPADPAQTPEPADGVEAVEPARRRTDKTVASILAPIPDSDVEGLIKIYNGLAGDHVHAAPRRFAAELAAAMAEHLADRRADPLWTLRHADVLDGGRP